MNGLPKLPSFDAAWSAIPIALLIYGLLLYDARRRDSPTAGDDQLGIKTVAATLAVVSTLLFAMGLQGFFQVILTFDDFGARLKAAIPSLVVGGLGVVGTALVLFPSTNAGQYPKAKRLAAGVVALVSGVALLPALVDVLTNVLEWPSWRLVALSLATALTAGVLFVASTWVLGRLSGVKMPAPKPKATATGPGGPPSYGAPAPGPGYASQPLQGYAGAPMQPPGPGFAAPPVQQPGLAGPPPVQQQPVQQQPVQQQPGPGGYPPQG